MYTKDQTVMNVTVSVDQFLEVTQKTPLKFNTIASGQINIGYLNFIFLSLE